MNLQIIFNSTDCSAERRHLIRSAVVSIMRKHFNKTDPALNAQLPEEDWKDTCGYISCLEIKGLEDYDRIRALADSLHASGIGFTANFGTDMNTGNEYFPSCAVIMTSSDECTTDNDVLRANFVSGLH